MICSGQDGAEHSSSGLCPQPNSYTPTQTSKSDSAKTKLWHELHSSASSLKGQCNQIASLKHKVKIEHHPLWGRSLALFVLLKYSQRSRLLCFGKAFLILFYFFLNSHLWWVCYSCLLVCGCAEQAGIPQTHLSRPWHKLDRSWIMRYNNDSIPAMSTELKLLLADLHSTCWPSHTESVRLDCVKGKASVLWGWETVFRPILTWFI